MLVDQYDWGLISFFFFLGLIFGSFATVVSWRVPKGEGIGGRSKCPNCGHQIGAVENIPVLSYFLLRGKCRNCGTKISIRYPLIELASGLLFAGAAYLANDWSNWPYAVYYSTFFWALLVLTVIDLDHKLLPNKLTYPLVVVVWAFLLGIAIWQSETGFLLDALFGMLTFAGLLFLIAFIYPRGMGMGDVKLALSLGTVLGAIDYPGRVFLAMFLSFLLGGVIGIVAGRLTGQGRKMQIPFGPFLMAGTVISIFWGASILDWYLGLGAA